MIITQYTLPVHSAEQFKGDGVQIRVRQCNAKIVNVEQIANRFMCKNDNKRQPSMCYSYRMIMQIIQATEWKIGTARDQARIRESHTISSP